MAEHTPGPWNPGRSDMGTVVDNHLSKWIYAGDQYVAVASGRIAGPWDEVMANARLIAAAPDLLAACKAMLPLCRCGGTGHLERRKYDAASGEMEWDGFDDCPHCKAARNAIRMAEGTDQAAGE